jgi:ABC-type uncharacterized transport system ATPase subunit
VSETSIGRVDHICLVVGAADVFGIIGVSESNIASLYDIIVGREQVETGRNSAQDKQLMDPAVLIGRNHSITARHRHDHHRLAVLCSWRSAGGDGS